MLVLGGERDLDQVIPLDERRAVLRQQPLALGAIFVLNPDLMWFKKGVAIDVRGAVLKDGAEVDRGGDALHGDKGGGETNPAELGLLVALKAVDDLEPPLAPCLLIA